MSQLQIPNEANGLGCGWRSCYWIEEKLPAGRRRYVFRRGQRLSCDLLGMDLHLSSKPFPMLPIAGSLLLFFRYFLVFLDARGGGDFVVIFEAQEAHALG